MNMRRILLFLLFVATWVSKTLLLFCYADIHSIFIVKLFWPILIGGFIFITQRYRWTVILQILYDILLVVCTMYWDANKVFPDINIAVDSFNQWEDFAPSLLSFLSWKLLAFPLITVIYCIGLYLLKTGVMRPSKNAFVLCVAIWATGQMIYSGYDRWKEQYYHNPDKIHIDYHIENGHPFGQRYGAKGWKLLLPGGQIGHGTDEGYIYRTDLLGYELSCLADFIWSSFFTEHIRMTDQAMEPFTFSTQPTSLAHEDLIILLIESLESWVLDYKDLDGNYAMPHLRAWMNEGPALIATQLVPQIRHGVSGDGQMTILTGLLPTQHNAACIKYAENTYPAISKCFKDTRIIAPMNSWGQDKVNVSYGIRESYWGEADDRWHDRKILEVTDAQLDDTPIKDRDPRFILSLTYSTHTPFEMAEHGTLNLDKGMDRNRQLYLQCINYLDQSLSLFFEHYRRSPVLQQSTIVLTGDHTIFRSDDTFCPLIIRSPHISGTIHRTDKAYQMDIYPTMMSIMGLDKHLWKGFGINLLDSDAERKLSEAEAYSFSDQIIRSNYFNNKL